MTVFVHKQTAFQDRYKQSVIVTGHILKYSRRLAVLCLKNVSYRFIGGFFCEKMAFLYD